MIMNSMGTTEKRLVEEILSLGCSVYRLWKDTGVSPTTAKAWAKGWWSPSEERFQSLYKLKMSLIRDIEESQKLVSKKRF